MIRFQIVDLFPKENGPEIFTDEFDGVQGSLRTRFEDTVAVKKEKFRFRIRKKTRGEGEGERERKVGREGGEREREAYTYRSTRPCPTRYPRPSKRQKTASRVSSLSMWDVVVFAAPVAIEVVVVAGALLSIVAAAVAVLVLGAAGVRSCCCWCVALLDAGAAAAAAGVVDAEALLRILLLRNSSMRACSRAWSWSVMRWASGTSSMRRKSRQETFSLGLMMSSSGKPEGFGCLDMVGGSGGGCGG